MLGLHEDIQDKAREELDSIIVDDECDYFHDASDDQLAKELRTTNITTDQLHEMKYLDRVIKETLRMWPSIPFVARDMTEDLTVGKYRRNQHNCYCCYCNHRVNTQLNT